MFERPPNRIAFRGFMVAISLALLAGCLPHTNPAPAVPTALAAVAGNGVVTLTWTASSGALTYNVKRASKTGGPYTQLANPSSATYTDTAVTNGTAYFYVVSSLDAAGESSNSAEVSATPQFPIPAVPANLVATAGNAVVTLTWTASTNATGYNVKRSTTQGGPYTQLAAPTTPTYTDSAVTNGTKYYYVVSAFDAAGESANSAEVSATPAIQVVPAAPTNLKATAGNAQVSLTWTASTGATSYHVKRGTTNGGPYTQIAAPTTTSFTDTTVTNGTTYYYVVTAVNSAGESPNSAQVVAVPFTGSPPPTFGTWINVTPAGVDPVTCTNAGARTLQADTAHPSNLYTEFDCFGIWKSTDFGATWTGPLNTGTGAAAVGDCEGGITIPPGSTASVPTVYLSCIRRTGLGFWRSTDGGVNFTQFAVVSSGMRQDYNPPAVDPYDPNHLVMAAHEFDSTVESVDGGQTWASVHLEAGMIQTNRTAFIFFINTGTASTTRGTWLWIGDIDGGGVGTWRTVNKGTNWVQVDKNEHPGGTAQIYQPDNNGVVFMAGTDSALGGGVLRSTDYGQTWSHVGLVTDETIVFGSSQNIYAMYAAPADPHFEGGTQPGTGTWVAPGTPAGLNLAAQVAVVNDGTHNILVGAMWEDGVWRYVEP